MIIADFGTSYCKILDLSDPQARPSIVPSKDLPRGTRVDMASGHNGKRFADHYVNELIALARGGETLIEEPDYVLADCGSRDLKYITIKGRRLENMGWNAECGASLGFSVELLGRYYDLDFASLPAPERPFSVTCGVLGMSHIFDAVVAGESVEEAVARYVKGIAINAHRFVGSPAKMYLSGGLCENPLFLRCLPCEVVPLGRFVLLEGLANMVRKLDLGG